MRYVIRVTRRHDLTNKKTMTETNVKTKDKGNDKDGHRPALIADAPQVLPSPSTLSRYVGKNGHKLHGYKNYSNRCKVEQ